MLDLRVALRTLRRHPVPAAVIVVTLACAIVAAIVVFATIDMTWRFLPIADREGLFLVASSDARRSGGSDSGPLRSAVSAPDLMDWMERAKSFESLAALEIASATMLSPTTPLSVSTARVTVNLLSQWGLLPAVGRPFRVNEGGVGLDNVVLLTDAFWDRHFLRDPSVLGQAITLDERAYTIIGVLPPRVSAGLLRRTDVVVPLVVDDASAERDRRTLLVTGRLMPHVTRKAAASELETISTQLADEHPTTNRGIGALVLPLIEATGMNVRLLLGILVLISGLILGLAFANVANVLLADGAARMNEVAIRVALGATRWNRMRQLLAEHFVLACAAGTVAVFLAAVALAALRRLAIEMLGFGGLVLSWRVALAATAISLVSPFLFGLLPAWRLTVPGRDELRGGAQSIGPGPRTGRLLQTFTGVQVAIAVVLMAQIAALATSAWRLRQMDTGFNPDRVLTFRVQLPPAAYSSPARLNSFRQALSERVANLPGVSAVGTTDQLPIADREVPVPFIIDGQDPSTDLPLASRVGISGNYLAAMGLPLRRGRSFTEVDAPRASRLAVVNETAARRYWPGRDPIGSRVSFETDEPNRLWLVVTGVVGDVRNSDADQPPLATIYTPASLTPMSRIAFVLRAEGAEPLRLVPAIRVQVGQLDRGLAITDAATMEQILTADLSGTIVLASILVGVAFVALCLAGSGIYGVVASSVGRRGREIAVRIALGALPRRVVAFMMLQTAVPVIVGAGTGSALAVVMNSAAASTAPEFGIGAATGYFGIVALLLCVAVLASYLPARRATRVDPVTALRSE